MARHQIGDALLALRENQLDRRTNGVFDYDQVIHHDTQGPGAVTKASGTTSVSANSFDGQISGDRIVFSQQSIDLDPNGDPQNERIDAIVGSPDGNISAFKGDLSPQTTTENEAGETITLQGRKNPRSQPPDLRSEEVVVLAAVRVPPDGSPINQDDIYDLRRPALDLSGDQSQNVLGIPYSSLDSADHNRVGQAVIVPPNKTLEVHSWGLCWKDEWGASGPETGHQLRLLNENHEQIESTNSAWVSSDGSENPLFSISNDTTTSVPYQFQVRNQSGEDFTWDVDMRGLSANVYYRFI